MMLCIKFCVTLNDPSLELNRVRWASEILLKTARLAHFNQTWDYGFLWEIHLVLCLLPSIGEWNILESSWGQR